jgi:hypothetical protein
MPQVGRKMPHPGWGQKVFIEPVRLRRPIATRAAPGCSGAPMLVMKGSRNHNRLK